MKKLKPIPNFKHEEKEVGATHSAMGSINWNKALKVKSLNEYLKTRLSPKEIQEIDREAQHEYKKIKMKKTKKHDWA